MTNEKVLPKARIELLTTKKCRKIAFLGHELRGEKYSFLQLFLKGKIGVGKKQMFWLRKIRQWIGVYEAGELFRLADDREELSTVIANVRKTGKDT